MARRPEQQYIQLIQKTNENILLLAKGQTGLKNVAGHEVHATPITGVLDRGENAVIGVGLFAQAESPADLETFYGVQGKRRLIQSWRAMNLVGDMTHVNNSALLSSWHAVSKVDDILTGNAVHILESGMGGPEQFASVRSQALKTAPDAASLDKMLGILKKNKIGVDGPELQQEIEDGTIAKSTLVEEFMAKDEQRRRKEEWIESKSAEPLPPEKSITALLRDLGISTSLVAGDFSGPYKLTWGIIPPEEIEIAIKRQSLSKKGPLELWRMVALIDGDLTPGIETDISGYGAIAHPMVQDSQGPTYVFKSARFTSGQISIDTDIITPDGKVKTKKLAVPELRRQLQEVIDANKKGQSTSGRTAPDGGYLH